MDFAQGSFSVACRNNVFTVFTVCVEFPLHLLERGRCITIDFLCSIQFCPSLGYFSRIARLVGGVQGVTLLFLLIVRFTLLVP